MMIIGVLAAIAVPRFSAASTGSSEAALKSNLRTMRAAIDFYAQEHGGDWPAMRNAGDGAGLQNGVAFERQLTWYTDVNGDAVTTRNPTHYLGPYLERIPPLPVGSRAGNSAVNTLNTFSTPGLSGASYGWEAEHYFGNIRANLPADEIGSDGVPYYQW